MDRDAIMRKIRALLAMGTDGRGNMNEAEAAMRQAQAMMRKYQVEESEVVLDELRGKSHMRRASESPYAYKSSDIPTKVPAWVGVISIGVGRLTDTVIDIIMDSQAGARVRFSGYAPDVEFACWLYRYLIETVHRLAKERGGRRSELESFRRGAAAELQRRLYALAAERDAEDKAEAGSGAGTALMVVNTKRAAVAEAFGGQRMKNTSGVRDAMSAMAGRQAASRIAIHTNRPIGGSGGKAGLLN